MTGRTTDRASARGPGRPRRYPGPRAGPADHHPARPGRASRRAHRRGRRTGEPKAAHIVKTKPGESAVAKVTEARIYGLPVEALCGERFIPQRDPGKLPMCQACKEIYDLYRGMNESLDDTPGT